MSNRSTFNDIFGGPPQSSSSPSPSPSPSPLPGASAGVQAPATSSGMTGRLDASGVVLDANEVAAYAKLFKLADAADLGVIQPPAAVSFLSKSRLPQETLGQIWTLADTERRGFLNQAGFTRALKLIAASQAGHAVTAAALALPTPLPLFEGITLDLPARNTAVPIPVQRTGDLLAPAAPLSITAEECERFTEFFHAAKPINGALPGDVARDLFLKSNLPIETLGKIWNLVDTSASGKLPLHQFIIAMLIITKLRQNQISTVPTSIPSELWNSVAIASPAPPTSAASALAAPPATAATIRGSNPQLASRTMEGDLLGGISSSTSTRTDPARASSVDNLAPTISEEDKRTYGGYFEKLDTQRKGYLTGEQCSPFFLKSNLPAIDLGKIWDLVDTAKSGRISKDGFATAMSLIKKRMAGAELPTSLSATPRPSNILDLPAMSSTAQADPFDPLGRASVAPTSLTAPPLTMSPIVPHSTGDKFSGSFGLGSATTTAPMFTIPQISRPSTLSQYQEAAEREADVNSRREEVKRLTEQLQLLHPTAEELKKKRDELDADFKAVTDEKNKLTIEILQARATYDAEVQIVRDSQALLMSESQRLESSKYELKQIQEAITALREEHSSLTEQIQAYQKDIAESKRLIQISTEETNELRGELEKLRTDARQQQQLVEVNQRLLSSAQLEHQQFKMDLQQERERLEYARQKAAQLQQQASVQSAINQRELGSVKALEKERQREISRSNDILASMAATPAVDYASGRAASL
eukprot:jgi/Hompol1/542/HPOL_001628-RA